MSEISNFIKAADNVIKFIAEFDDFNPNTHTEDTLEIHVEEITELWNKVKLVYARYTSADCGPKKGKPDSGEDSEEESDEAVLVRKRYNVCYEAYVKSRGNMKRMMRELSSKSSRSKEERGDATIQQGFQVPPCDMEIFSGDYLKWPSFRDLFTAVYVKNSRLSKVEKLFHLNAKTSGDAKEIVRNAPLTNDGFDVAWTALCHRFENKRMLVNGQLRILFNLPVIAAESGDSIKKLQSSVNNAISALRMHNVDVSNWDCILIYLCSIRLPELTLSMWEQSVKNRKEIPAWTDFDDFLTSRYETLETVSDLRSSSNDHFKRNADSSNFKDVKSHQTNISNACCQLCPTEQHTIRKCPKFEKMKIQERIKFIKNHGLCFNCFSSAHAIKDCTGRSCFTCGGRHNTMIHQDSTSQNPKSVSQNKARYSTNCNSSSSSSSNSNSNPNCNSMSSPNSNFNTSMHRVNSNSRSTDDSQASGSQQSQQVRSNFATSSKGVLLGTAVVQVYYLGSYYPARALIDSGSEGTFISERLFKVLNITAQNISAQISGLNNGVSARCSKICPLVLSSRFNPSLRIEAKAFVIPQVTGMLPSCNIDVSNFQPLEDIQLADSDFHTRSDIDLLIGSDLVPTIMRSGVKHNLWGSLLGQETVFGWILSGPVFNISSFSTSIAIEDEQSLDKSISRFWEVEELSKKPIVSEEDRYCEEYYRRTTKRGSDGRYVVSLPFKDEAPHGSSLGNSRPSAFAQFLRNETRLLKMAETKAEYDKVLSEYIQLDHMHPAPIFKADSVHYYFPHHAVIKPESLTTKLRVVFNASCPTASGKSLNDILHVGPVLQLDLTLLILRWRTFQYVFNADIEKMYRQIRVDPAQQSFQRLLFRDSPNDLIKDYEMSTVTFGMNCAPYLAIRTLHQLSDDVKEELPRASTILREYMYVDDVLAGAHTISEAIRARDEVTTALSSAGFSLRKWTSNSKSILSGVAPEHILNSEFLEFEDSSIAKTLGIRWNAQSDIFYFSALQLDETKKITKREFLSQISKLFDPAGWLAPCIVIAKMLMQKIWLEKIDWDQQLPDHLLQEWRRFLGEFPNIGKIQIPRWIGYGPNAQIQFHVFCDASEKAYAAAVYVRISTEDSTSTILLTAKSRVAPVKTVSLPRLELCGAVLAAELAENVVSELRVPNYDIFFWTDSTIVLAWLRKPPCTWSTFVANRVSSILQCVGQANWFHVDTHFNPADLATRGVLPGDLIANTLWWNGPEWLQRSQSQWPYSETETPETQLEFKSIRAHFTYFKQFDDVLERFSDLAKGLRVLVYVFRFFQRCKSKARVMGPITREEIHFVKERLIIVNQQVAFPEEYKALTNKESVSKTSSLLSFNPFIDGKGILRVSGRLVQAPGLSYDERHPMILPYNCELSRLLVRFTHLISLHGDNELVHRLIRLQFAIPKVKNLIKATIHRCKICVIHKQKVQSQLMGALPAERTTCSRPFSTTGVDFAGPFDIKSFSGRGCRMSKGYVCLFVCFSTRAIHLEAVSDLSTESFLAAFHRFASRRGCPSQVVSDNGRNFVGAAKAIAQDFLKVIQQKTEDAFQAQQLTWKFIPPGAPHMGGLWEAGVKSFKKHFKKVAGDFKFTFEEFGTLLSKIEACLNSRPISAMTENPNDPVALTPGHFLIGAPLLAPAEPEIQDSPSSIIRHWQRLKALHQTFCHRWKRDYLHQLQNRPKWKTTEENIQKGMLVVVREDNLPPNEWRLGIVENVITGKDALARVADLRTSRGTIRRPICKLIVLPSN